MEAAVLGSGFDDPVDKACHLACHGDVGHALAVRAEGILPDIWFELLSKAVLSLFDCDGSGHPEGASKPTVAVLGQLGAAPTLFTAKSPIQIADQKDIDEGAMNRFVLKSRLGSRRERRIKAE